MSCIAGHTTRAKLGFASCVFDVLFSTRLNSADELPARVPIAGNCKAIATVDGGYLYQMATERTG